MHSLFEIEAFKELLIYNELETWNRKNSKS